MSTPLANHLVNQRSGSQFSDDAIADRALALLNARFAEHWSISRLSAEVGTNRTRLQHAFRFLTGVTIHSYLTDKRISEAVKLLRDRRIKVLNDVDYEVDRVTFDNDVHLVDRSSIAWAPGNVTGRGQPGNCRWTNARRAALCAPARAQYCQSDFRVRVYAVRTNRAIRA